MDAKLRARVERFGRRLTETFEKAKKQGRLGELGSFAVILPGTVCWTVFPSGPRAGVHAEMFDDVLDFVLVMKPDVFLEMYSDGPYRPLDVDRAIAEKRLAMSGDFNAYLAFLRINEAADLLSIRLKPTG